MIYKLQKKFVKICITAFLLVFFVVFSTIIAFFYSQTTNESDKIADIITQNNETFPIFDKEHDFSRFTGILPNSIGPETPFTTRFFTVRFNEKGQYISANTNAIASVSGDEAMEYGQKALQKNSERGWVGLYRYKISQTPQGTSVIFINNNHLKITLSLICIVAGIILLVGGLIFLSIVVLLSKRAVKPIAESYEKQKRFITDANHELKTPLTLMLTNLDIIESETGPNEWLDDVRFEGNKMAELIEKLVYLARMDEDGTKLEKVQFDLSETVNEMVTAFMPLAKSKSLIMTADITPGISYYGDDTAIRQLISVLIENAIKYCDSNGNIEIRLKKDKTPIFMIDNHYSGVSELKLDSLFDRFYRSDKARTYGTGFGVGLSVAKAIADKHDAEIWAQNINNTKIRFSVKL